MNAWAVASARAGEWTVTNRMGGPAKGEAVKPICVAEHLLGGGLYDYHDFCGACRHHLGGSDRDDFKRCPWCGTRIDDSYTFADGVQEWTPLNGQQELPEVWPDFDTRTVARSRAPAEPNL